MWGAWSLQRQSITPLLRLSQRIFWLSIDFKAGLTFAYNPILSYNESSKNNKASQIIESSQINSIITNFTNKLNKDFGKSKKGNNSNSIQELKNNSNLTNKSNKDFGKSKKGNNSNNSIQELKNNSNLTNKDFRKSKKGNKINNNSNSNSNIQELTTNEIIELIKNN